MVYVIGLMSGTSLDGVDAALVDISEGQTKLIHFETVPLPDDTRQRILDCCSPERSNIVLACSLNAELGRLFADAARAVCRGAGIPLAQVLCIASHGQTVYHIPQDEGGWLASTLQLGEPAVIAYETGVQVVSGFRAMDMAAGGRGAPLVPYTEYLLYRSDMDRALLNIGGIANVTVLPARCAMEDVLAFDTGPGNMIMDALTRRLFDLPYDARGALAAMGQPDETILAEWMGMPYFRLPPPKATGREQFGEQFVQHALDRWPLVQPHDWLATAAHFTARSVMLGMERFVFPHHAVAQLVISGGGSHNQTLLNLMSDLLPDTCRLLRQEDLGWPSDAKEAVAFALLGYETIHGRPGNLPAATGARCSVILGNITPRPLGRG